MIRLCIIIPGIDYIAKQPYYKELFMNAIMSNGACQLLVQRILKPGLPRFINKLLISETKQIRLDEITLD